MVAMQIHSLLCRTNRNSDQSHVHIAKKKQLPGCTMRDPAGGGYLAHRINKERTSKKVTLLSVADYNDILYEP